MVFGSMTFELSVQKFLNIKFNFLAGKFGGIWNVSWVLLGEGS
jgi:hypothetical protein